MKIVGLITEYNPFHNGHAYHIGEALKVTGADYAIVVMSGNFVQRGTPAIMPKHLRTEICLKNGCALVIELPLLYATGSAEFFCHGAVSLLHSLGCVDAICFGSESGSLEPLYQLADLLLEEPEDFQSFIQANLKKGMSYPVAREHALISYLDQDQSLAASLMNPNDILGVEYIKAIKRLHSPMAIHTIKRQVSHYHDTQLQTNYSSATAIRSELKHNAFTENLQKQLPANCISLLTPLYEKRFPIYPNDFSLLLKYKLLKETKESLQTYLDVNEELANRILKMRNNFLNFEQFCNIVKTKNVTHSRVCRCLIHILLDIKSLSLEEIEHHYIHVLGFRKDSTAVLSKIKATSALPLITKLTASNILSPTGVSMLEQDIYAANLYESVITNKYNTSFIHECEQSLIMV